MLCVTRAELPGPYVLPVMEDDAISEGGRAS